MGRAQEYYKRVTDGYLNMRERTEALDALCGMKGSEAVRLLGRIADDGYVPRPLRNKALACFTRKELP